ncbi:ubiquitin conjugation factor e4 b [Phlyctema vagabunda]|uniref:peptidylprolyl isomerase n=1 Tax=Phlyctema vagabunda TaxID=108571 RepID=A0ABR4PWG6_9HELO
MEKLSGPATPKTEQSTANSGASSSSATPTAASPAPAAESTAKPKINVRKAPANPFAQLGVQPANGAAPVRSATAERFPKRTRAESGEQNTNPPKKTVKDTAEEPIEEYENRVLGQIFRITLDPNQKVDLSNHRLTYLPNLRQELEEGNEPLRISVSNLDSAILEACSLVPHNRPVLEYLLPCWKRSVKALKGLKGYANQKDAILKEAKRLCMSNCIFAVKVPELFSREPNPLTDPLTPFLLHEQADDRGICLDFLAEAVSRFEEDDTAKTMLVEAVTGLSYQLSNMTMNDNYRPYITALKTIAHFPPVVTAIAESPLFLMAQSAPGIEKNTLLGPFFRISPLQIEVAKHYFAGPKTMDKRHIITSQDALRLTLQNHQQDLLDIINLFVRASPISKNKTLDWFAWIVNSNHMRRALQTDPRTVSTDGFMMNVTVVLDGLCEPFMDTTFSKVSKIDIDYLRREPRVAIKDETKLNADQNASDEYYESKVAGVSNFISEVFFLTLAAHHYGSEGVNSNLRSLEKDIKHIQKQMVLMQSERQKLLNDPRRLAIFDAQVKKYDDALEKSMSLQYAIQGVLFDKKMQTKSLLFMRYVTVWLLRIASSTEYTPEKSLVLPLSHEQPKAFTYLPEYVLEDIVSNFNFIFRYVPDVMISAVGDEVMTLCITFLTNSEYIKNPYLKAKLVSLLFHGTWPVYHRTKGVLGDSLTGTVFANKYLLHALMKFYNECEQTGAHTQFYDKFNIRYEIFQVVKCIWSNDVYKQKLRQESKTNVDFFLQFVNLLLNDATYVLDESLQKFPKIHELQIELRTSGASLSAEDRAKKEEELQSAESQATSYMQLANETMSMMKLFTSALSESFTMQEIVGRLASMLNYNLSSLTGPKSNELKVEEPQKYGFNPKILLADFVEIYLNLGLSQSFVDAVARDGRSYKPTNFDSTSRIMQRHGLKSAEDMQKWETLKHKFKLAKQIEEEEEEDMGEIPDELMDPITGDIFQDPVILPMSKATLSRATIRQHLLSDGTDPYNRQPMRIEDVVPDTDMQAKIDEFREMRKRDKQDKITALRAQQTEIEAESDVTAADKMDTSQ